MAHSGALLPPHNHGGGVFLHIKPLLLLVNIKHTNPLVLTLFPFPSITRGMSATTEYPFMGLFRTLVFPWRLRGTIGRWNIALGLLA